MLKRPMLLVLLALLGALIVVQYFNVPSRPTIFSNDPFEKAQSEAAKATPPRLLVVDFTASWCGPCRQMDRSTWVSSSVTEWLKQHAVAVKVDIDEDRARARTFGITAIPTVVVLKGNQVVARMDGLRDASQLLETLRPLASE